MKILLAMFTAALPLLCCSPVSAEDCKEKANTDYTACVEAAGKFINDIEVEDAKAVCSNQYSSALQACDDLETGRNSQPAGEQQ
jgi:hypothetical protein